MRKSALFIQTKYRKHLAYNKLNVLKANRILLINRIGRAVKKFLVKLHSEKNNAAHKIQYLFKSNYEANKIYNNIKSKSNFWLRNKDPSRNYAATVIQRYWRAYKLEILDLFYDNYNDYSKLRGNSIEKDSNLSNKIKLCLTCKTEKSTHLCRNVYLIK